MLIGIWVAIYGIDSWRREHIGKRRIELAEETLALFYEAVEAIKYMRSPASFASETEHVTKQESEDESDYRARKNASIVFKRYQDNKELISKIRSTRYRFMSQMGIEATKPFDDIHGIVSDIQFSANMLARLWARGRYGHKADDEKQDKLIQKHEAIFWSGFGDQDPIDPRLASAIKDIENTCRGIIVGKSTLHGLLNRKML